MTRCPRCDAEIPEGGSFCIECGAPAPASTGPTERLPQPAAGPACAACGTRNPPGADFCVHCGRALAGRALADRLPPPRLDQPPLAQPLAPLPASAGVPARGQRAYVNWDGLTGGIWLIGLAVLFMTGWWWPGILVLVGLSSLFSGLAHAPGGAGRLGAVQGAAWMIGLAIIAANNWWWPGMLVLVGISAALGAISFREH